MITEKMPVPFSPENDSIAGGDSYWAGESTMAASLSFPQEWYRNYVLKVRLSELPSLYFAADDYTYASLVKYPLSEGTITTLWERKGDRHLFGSEFLPNTVDLWNLLLIQK